MAAFTSFPTDIVQIILHSIVDRAGSGIKAARVKIPLLAVCREWRAIVVPLFYNEAYFRSYKRHDFSSQPSRTYFEAQTNLSLALQNGHGDRVKRFVYLSQEEEYAANSLMRLALMLDINTDNCPELDSLMDYYDKNSNKRLDWNNVDHIAAIKTIATTLASKLPNIKRLGIHIRSAHGIAICFLSALTDCFADKLVEFNYNGPLKFRNKQPMIGLQTMNLHLVGWYQNRMYPVVCPRTITKLTILADNIPFDWKLFSTDQNSDVIVFEALEYLYCRGSYPDGFIDDSDITRRLHFPSIKMTVAHNFALTNNHIHHQLRSGLQTLDYTNDLPKLLELSRLDLSSLTGFKLKFGPTSSAAEDFVVKTNTLFGRFNGIPTVQCEIYSITHPAYLDGIYWPNLTHLVFNATVVHGNIFEAALSMPNLIHLELYPHLTHQNALDSKLEYLESLRSNHTEPSGSNIVKLEVKNVYKKFGDQLSTSIQVLKWYWPKLTIIDMHIIASPFGL